MERADAIFAFAGREERKRHAVDLYKRGTAPRLILSVGRFEWRKFEALGLPDDGGLLQTVESIEPTKRHFFVQVQARGATCEAVRKGPLGTLTEARALAELIERLELRDVLLLSSKAHLPRCLLSVRMFLRPPCRLRPIATPEESSGAVKETLKMSGYRALQPLVRFEAIARKL